MSGLAELSDEHNDVEITSESILLDSPPSAPETLEPESPIRTQPTDETIDEDVQNNYRNWKLNSIKLYDYLNTSNLVWPSLSIEWFPFKELNKYRLLTSTYTSAEFPNHLQIGSITIKPSVEEVSLKKYDQELNEFQSSSSNSSFKVDQSLLHKGDTNKSRILPQNPDIISTINNNGEIFIFDKTKHPSLPSSDFRYEIKLDEHKKEGYGLSWNNVNEGVLLSCSIDGDTKIWDIKKYESNELSSLSTINTDLNGTNDVQWNPLHDSIFSTVGEDNIVKIHDRRNSNIIKSGEFHSNGINSLSFNYQNSFALSTVDSSGTLNIWDIRNFQTPSISIKNAHNGSISSVQFNPNRPNLLATGGEDGFVNIYDLAKDQDQVVFKHGGHLLAVNDFNWNPNEDLMIASVSNDNTLQIWKPSAQLLE